MKYDCAGVGICPVDHLVVLKSYPASNEKTQALTSDIQGGGPAATAMVALSRLGRKTAVVGGVGDDANASLSLSEFKREGVSVKGLKKHKGRAHPVAHIWVDKRNGNRTVVLTQKLPHLRSLSSQQRSVVCQSRFLLVDGTEPEIGLRAIRLAKRNGIPIMLDADSIRETTRKMVSLADIVIGSEHFAHEYMPGASIKQVVKRIQAQGARVAGITRGHKGSVVFDGNRFLNQKPYKVRVADTTGAGDVFHGAFVEGMLRGWPLAKAQLFATVVAGIKCKMLGGRKGIPSFSQAFTKAKF